MKRFFLLLIFTLALASPALATEIFRDTFTAAAGTDIDARAPDTGTSWTRILTRGSVGEVEMFTGGVTASTNGTDSGSGSIYTANTTYSTANYEVEVTFSTITGVGATRSVTIFCRIQDVDNFYVGVILDPNDTNDVRLYKVVSGTATELGTTEDTAPATNDVFTLVCNGTSISLEKNGSAVVGPVTDAAISAAGEAGLGGGDFDTAGDGAGFATAGANMLFTLFTVTTIDAPATSPQVIVVE